MGSTPQQSLRMDDFLRPMTVDVEKCHVLSRAFMRNFMQLAACSGDQFLPTPISESILRPISDHGRGRHLAIDIGGTNLRVGFVELSASEGNLSDDAVGGADKTRGAVGDDLGGRCVSTPVLSPSRLRRQLEKSWPIANHLKHDNADSLFLWIGECMAEVIGQGCQRFGLARDAPIPLGVTFSFPMQQPSLDRAVISSMGKGFAMPPNLDLGVCLKAGYDKHRLDGTHHLPPIYVAAIANDSVSTLVSFIFSHDRVARRRAAMGLILGTGSNATIPVKLSMLHPSKRPRTVNVLAGERADDVKIAVNTEWSINGTAPPMRELGLMTAWDDELSAQNEKPGFQPLEYMTAGRYLGELGRIMLLDYLCGTLKVPRASLPRKLLQQGGLSTTFLSRFRPLEEGTMSLLARLRAEFPDEESEGKGGFGFGFGFVWTEHEAEALYRIAKAIEVRAAGIIAAAILALLTVGGELPAEEEEDVARAARPEGELGVGYTGGCVAHFQDYLADCQEFVNQLVRRRFGKESRVSVVLRPCHDGGITGAGILVAAALSSQTSSQTVVMM